MFVIGITGGIGCGKTTVARICGEQGLPVIDADEISRVVTSEGGKAIPEIVEHFGRKILDAEGGLDRTKMAGLVFKNRKSLDELSRIVHRHVTEEMTALVDKLRENKCKAVVLDVPIPVKKGFLDLCDQVWVVWSDDQVRLSRLSARGMETEEAMRRMSCQMTREEYAAIGDIVLDNSGSPEELETTVKTILNEQLGMRGINMTRKETKPPSSRGESPIEKSRNEA
jgi:dephospho-CoA kinase